MVNKTGNIWQYFRCLKPNCQYQLIWNVYMVIRLSDTLFRPAIFSDWKRCLIPQACASWSSCVCSGWQRPCSSHTGRVRLCRSEPPPSSACCRSPSPRCGAWSQPKSPWPERTQTNQQFGTSKVLERPPEGKREISPLPWGGSWSPPAGPAPLWCHWRTWASSSGWPGGRRGSGSGPWLWLVGWSTEEQVACMFLGSPETG